MTYGEAEKRLGELDALGSRLGLETMRELCRRLKNPQDNIQTVHVAGTNGKGTTIAVLADSLSSVKQTIGTYTSPCLECWRENIRLNGEWISEADAAELLTEIFQVCEQMTADGCLHPSRFEVETALAFLYFDKDRCDIAFIETGLGGRDDATNVISKPELVVLTPVSLDHTDVLGNTLSEIAEIKCSIIKDGAAVAYRRQSPEVMAVIERVCKEKHVSSLVPLETYFDFEKSKAALRWFGRFSIICHKPLFIVDGAHNPAGVEWLLGRLASEKGIIFLAGIFRDKDYEAMLKAVAPKAKKIIAIDMPGNKRLLRAEELKKTAVKYHPDVTAALNPFDAVKRAFGYAGEQDVIVSFGSLSTIAAVTKAVKEITK